MEHFGQTSVQKLNQNYSKILVNNRKFWSKIENVGQK